MPISLKELSSVAHLVQGLDKLIVLVQCKVHQQIIRWSGKLGMISESEKVSFQMTVERKMDPLGCYFYMKHCLISLFLQNICSMRLEDIKTCTERYGYSSENHYVHIGLHTANKFDLFNSEKRFGNFKIYTSDMMFPVDSFINKYVKKFTSIFLVTDTNFS